MPVVQLRAREGSDFEPPACVETDPPAYCSTDPITRAQVAAFVARTFGFLLYGP